MNSSVFNDFLKSAKDVEERIASGKLFQTEVADGSSMGPRNNQSSGRRLRTKSSTCLDIRNSQKLSRQVLRCWAVKASVVEYHQPKCNTISDPQPVKTLQQWTDVVATTSSKYQSCSGVLNGLKLVNQLVANQKAQCYRSQDVTVLKPPRATVAHSRNVTVLQSNIMFYDICCFSVATLLPTSL